MAKSTPKDAPTPASTRRAPLPCFDKIEHIDDAVAPDYLTAGQARDFDVSREFLRAYTGSNDTFMAYRRDVERLLMWTWFIAGKVLEDLRRDDIETFIRFCQQPPKAWIGVKRAPRFQDKDGERQPNPEWRPFVATVSKSAFKKGQKPDKTSYSASNTAIKQVLAITASRTKAVAK